MTSSARPAMTAQEVKAAVARRHGSTSPSGEWTCIEEAFCGFASAGGGIDVLALGAWQTAKAPGLPGAGRQHGEIDARYPVAAYEVKVSRADYRREVNGYVPGKGASWRTRPVPAWPGKAYWALARSHYFLFAVPVGLLKSEEFERRERPADGGLWLPPEAGLIEVGAGGCRVRVPAPLRAARPLTAPEVAELVRHAVKPNRERNALAEVAHLRGVVDGLLRRLEAFEGREAA